MTFIQSSTVLTPAQTQLLSSRQFKRAKLSSYEGKRLHPTTNQIVATASLLIDVLLDFI